MKINRLSGVNTIDYYKVANKKILLLGFEHNVKGKCNNCTSKNKCYDIVDFIKKINKKLDIFYEAPIHYIKNKKLKNFNKDNSATFNEIIFENYIIPMFEEHSINAIKRHIDIDEKLINVVYNIIDNNDIDYNYINNIDIDYLRYLYNVYNSSTLEFELWFEFTKQQRNPDKANRFHYFDFRTIKHNPTFFFPHNYAIDYSIDTSSIKFKKYQNQFYNYMDEIKDDMKHLINFMCGINDNVGYKIYNNFYKIFVKNYKSDISKNKFYQIVNIYRKLISKQIKKSMIDKTKMINTFVEIIDTIPQNVYLDIFDGGLLFTELYSIPRMFKKYTKNILYIGGSAHCFLVSDFINIYFNTESEFTKEGKRNVNCIKNINKKIFT